MIQPKPYMIYVYDILYKIIGRPKTVTRRSPTV